jgi:hypothetical protein
MAIFDIFNRPKTGKVELRAGNENRQLGKLAVKNEAIIVIIKIICGLICVIIGAFLTYKGITTSEYSIIIQYKESLSIKCTNTPPGVILLIFSIVLLWKTKQDIKIEK